MAKSSSVCIISWEGAGEGELVLRDASSADADVDPNAECMRRPRNASFSSLLEQNLRAAWCSAALRFCCTIRRDGAEHAVGGGIVVVLVEAAPAGCSRARECSPPKRATRTV
jgi:hypothetical protein